MFASGSEWLLLLPRHCLAGSAYLSHDGMTSDSLDWTNSTGPKFACDLYHSGETSFGTAASTRSSREFVSALARPLKMKQSSFLPFGKSFAVKLQLLA